MHDQQHILICLHLLIYQGFLNQFTTASRPGIVKVFQTSNHHRTPDCFLLASGKLLFPYQRNGIYVSCLLYFPIAIQEQVSNRNRAHQQINKQIADVKTLDFKHHFVEQTNQFEWISKVWYDFLMLLCIVNSLNPNTQSSTCSSWKLSCRLCRLRWNIHLGKTCQARDSPPKKHENPWLWFYFNLDRVNSLKQVLIKQQK